MEFPKIICVCVYSTLVCGRVVLVVVVPPVHGNKQRKISPIILSLALTMTNRT